MNSSYINLNNNMICAQKTFLNVAIALEIALEILIGKNIGIFAY